MHFTVVFMDTVLQILVQMNVIIVVIGILIAIIVAQIPAIRRGAARVGEVKIHWAFIVPEAVREIQPVRFVIK